MISLFRLGRDFVDLSIINNFPCVRIAVCAIEWRPCKVRTIVDLRWENFVLLQRLGLGSNILALNGFFLDLELVRLVCFGRNLDDFHGRLGLELQGFSFRTWAGEIVWQNLALCLLRLLLGLLWSRRSGFRRIVEEIIPGRLIAVENLRAGIAAGSARCVQRCSSDHQGDANWKQTIHQTCIILPKMSR